MYMQIRNGSLRSNVLFNSNLDQSFYDKVIDASSLRPDLKVRMECGVV
jgi:hypothetical protein